MRLQLRIMSAILVLFAMLATTSYFQGSQHACASQNASSSPVAVQARQRWCDAYILRSKHFPPGGAPLPIDIRYHQADGSAGLSVVVREGFVAAHWDAGKVPLWVSYQWTEKLRAAAQQEEDDRRKFQVDREIPEQARGIPKYGKSARGLEYDRGHLAPNRMNLAWGSDNADSGDLMSNIAPQRPELNQRVWRALEDRLYKAVADGVDPLWIVVGCGYVDAKPHDTVANGIAVPQAFFCVTAWFDARKKLHARGYLYPQDAAALDPRAHLVPIAKIEELTGLIFFPELESATARALKEALPADMFGSL